MTCPICGCATGTALLKERNVSCGDYFEGRRLYEIDLGEIALLECTGCGFGYFGEMHAWPEDRFQSDIYNEHYHLCDPPFEDERPRTLAEWLGGVLQPCNLIDFGGGQGKLAELLVEKGFHANSYDPFYGNSRWPDGQADVVTAFEVVEHVPDQSKLFHSLKDLCRPGGVIIFSTLLKEKRLTEDWWYASPRNGHVSFHTGESLKLLMDNAGLAYASLSAEVHICALHAAALLPAVIWPPVQINDTPEFRFREGWSRMFRVHAGTS